MIQPATAEHFARLRLQPMQAAFSELLADRDYVDELVKRGAWAAVAHGRVLGIGGFVDQGAGRAHAWVLFANKIGHAFIALHRAARRELERAPYRRIELVTWYGFCEAHRWAQMLGFQPEARLEAWFPDGSDGLLWRRLKWPR